MLVDLVFGSKATWRVLATLGQSPGQGIMREEIKKLTKLGGNSIFRTMNLLLKNNIINAKKVGKRTYYSLNLNNKYSQLAVQIISEENKELNNLPFEYLIILREYVRQIIELIDVGEIYVFGSIVKGSFNKNSDIDFAIILDKEINVKEKIEIEKISERVEKRFGRDIETHYFNRKEFNLKNKLAEQIYRDGIKLI